MVKSARQNSPSRASRTQMKARARNRLPLTTRASRTKSRLAFTVPDPRLLLLREDDDVLPRQTVQRLEVLQGVDGHFLPHLLLGHLVDLLDGHLVIFQPEL